MSQAITLFANPGQTVSLTVQVIDGYGDRHDGYDGYGPEVMSVYFPDRTLANGFPTNMAKLSTGLYVHDLIIPTGSSSLGTFIASVRFKDPDTGNFVWQVFAISVARPFGNSSASPI